MPIKRIAVGQGGGPSPVINDSLAGVLYEAKQEGIGVVGLKNGLEGGGLNPEVKGNLIDLRSLDSADIDSIRGIPGAFLGTTRIKLDAKKEEDAEKIKRIRKNMDARGIEAIVYIGGNDSADVILNEGRGVHVQKTIDNDLLENDHTSGWGSACLANSEIIRRLTCDMSGFAPRVMKDRRKVYSTAPVVVYQTQGRDTGWLALGCAFAKVSSCGDVNPDAAPHLFLPREIPYDPETLLAKVDNLLSKKGYAFIVCGEEIVNSRGITLASLQKAKERADPSGHVEHGRAGSFNYAEYIASIIKNNLNVGANSGYLNAKETPLSPQHIQRCLMRSEVDADEAFESGIMAIRALLDRDFNVSVCLRRNPGRDYDIYPEIVPIEKVAGKVRHVDKKYLGTLEGPTPRFYRDFLPLLGGELALTHYSKPKLKAWKA